MLYSLLGYYLDYLPQSYLFEFLLSDMGMNMDSYNRNCTRTLYYKRNLQS